jgi:hypothetical protein
MSSLGNLVNKIQKKVLELTGARLFDWVSSRPNRKKPFMREGDYFRISSLYRLCAREEVLASRNEIIREEKIAPDLKITFDIGDLFHDLYRNYYWGPMGEWLGAWECRKCGWDTDKAGLSSAPIKDVSPARLAKMPLECPDCMSTREDNFFNFKEWVVKSEKLKLRGHPDGWQEVNNKAVIVDIKSHGANGFMRRRHVRDGHDVQVWAYQYCSNETKSVGKVIYLNKSPWGDHTAFVKDIDVPFDRRLFQAMVEKPLLELQNGLAGGSLPGKVCGSKGCPRAKNCSLRDICW